MWVFWKIFLKAFDLKELDKRLIRKSFKMAQLERGYKHPLKFSKNLKKIKIIDSKSIMQVFFEKSFFIIALSTGAFEYS